MSTSLLAGFWSSSLLWEATNLRAALMKSYFFLGTLDSSNFILRLFDIAFNMLSSGPPLFTLSSSASLNRSTMKSSMVLMGSFFLTCFSILLLLFSIEIFLSNSGSILLLVLIRLTFSLSLNVLRLLREGTCFGIFFCLCWQVLITEFLYS